MTFAAACGGAPAEVRGTAVARPAAPSVSPATPGRLTTDPDLARPAPRKLLAIDWAAVTLTSDADALALWAQIAPTGEDWEAKLDEIPDEGPIASRLALALLRAGNVACAPPPAAASSRCAPPPGDIPPPAPAATLADPCLRRMLALWSIGNLDDEDRAAANDALIAITRLPPPESQLVSAALDAVPEDDQDARLALRASAWQAGHHALVNGALAMLDVPHLIDAVRRHHIDGALEILPAEEHRALYLGAVLDRQLAASARTMAMVELTSLDGKLADDVRAALVTASRDPDCAVAAHAARTLVRLGRVTYGPARPRARTPEAMMRALCVAASYEAGLRADEPTFLPGYVPARGLEVVTIRHDPYGDVDADGDGDPRTERTATLVPRDELAFPELEDLVLAFARCSGTTCSSETREFRFGFQPGARGELLLARLEVIERPLCPLPN